MERRDGLGSSITSARRVMRLVLGACAVSTPVAAAPPKVTAAPTATATPQPQPTTPLTPLERRAAEQARDEARQAFAEGKYDVALRKAHAALAQTTGHAADPELLQSEWEILGRIELAEESFAAARADFAWEYAALQQANRGLGEEAALNLQRTAAAFTGEGNFAAAEGTLIQALRLRRTLNDNPAALASNLADLAQLFGQTSRVGQARNAVAEGLALLKPGGDAEDNGIYQLQMVLAALELREGDDSRSAAAFSAAADAAGRHERSHAADELDALQRLIDRQNRLKQFRKSSEIGERALRLDQRFPDAQSPRPEIIIGLIWSAAAAGDSARAKALLAQYHGASRVLHVDTSTFEDALPARDSMPVQEKPPRNQPEPPATVTLLARNHEVVDALRPAFNACYDAALATAPNTAGFLQLQLTLKKSASVAEVSALALWLPTSLVDCALTHAAKSQFDLHNGEHAVILVPLKVRKP